MRTIAVQSPLTRDNIPPAALGCGQPRKQRPLSILTVAPWNSHNRWTGGRVMSSSDDVHVRSSVIEITPHVTSFMNVLPATDSGHTGSAQILPRLDKQEHVADFEAQARLWPRAKLRSPYQKRSLSSRTRDLLAILPRKHIALVPAAAAH